MKKIKIKPDLLSDSDYLSHILFVNALIQIGWFNENLIAQMYEYKTSHDFYEAKFGRTNYHLVVHIANEKYKSLALFILMGQIFLILLSLLVFNLPYFRIKDTPTALAYIILLASSQFAVYYMSFLNKTYVWLWFKLTKNIGWSVLRDLYNGNFNKVEDKTKVIHLDSFKSKKVREKRL